MKNKEFRASTPKRFDDLMPKLDNGNTDWETVKKRVSQNMDATEMLLGKLPPQAIEVEKAVLGACLIDIEGFKKAKDVLTGFKNPFYTDAHNAIWSAMSNLNKNNENIDRLTVFRELERMLKTGVINGSPYYLSELTELVSSSAHIESHARILLQTHLGRCLMHQGIQLFQKATDPSMNLFDVIDEHLLALRKLSDFNTTLKTYSMPTVMEMAANATTKSFLVGSLIKKEDVTLLFSGTGNGKSIFSIQMADKISRGESLFDGLLRNDCGQQKVLYFDFELTLSDYKDRYIDGAGNKYPFLGDVWFNRVGNDEDNPKTFAEMAAKMEQILMTHVEKNQPHVIFVDNITAMSNGSTVDPETVRRVMDLLLLLKKRHKLTVIVLAHTPKRYDMSKPIVVEDLAGSSLLAAYVDSIITVGQSKMGEKVKYIKHIKSRSGAKIHDDQNIIQISIEKEGAFLHFKTLEEPTGRESDHLVSKYDASIDEVFIQEMVRLKEEGRSLNQIKEELSLKISRQYIGQLIKAYQQKKTNPEVTDFEEALKAPVLEM
jgi:DnaB-like helicase N terminal domain/AAA domain